MTVMLLVTIVPGTLCDGPPTASVKAVIILKFTKPKRTTERHASEPALFRLGIKAPNDTLPVKLPP